LILLGLAAARPGQAQDASEEVRERLEKSGLKVADLGTTYLASLQSGSIRMISLREVVTETLVNNLDIAIARLDRGISSDEINISLGIYDPVLAAQAVRTRIDTLSAREPVNFPGFTLDNRIHQNNDLFDASLSQLTPLGSVFTLSYTDSNTNVRDESRDSLVNPFYERQIRLGVVQPLMRNFGPTVTNSQIRIARHQEEISRYGILTQIDNQVANAMKTYWDLVFTIENLSVQQLFLKQAQDLLRINKIKYETGVLSQTDVLQAEAQVASGEERVIVSQSAIIGVQDQLKRLMNPRREPTEWDQPIVPEDLPTQPPVVIDAQEAISEALANRPEILQTRESIRIAEIGRDVAKWQRLPQLDFFGDYAINGAGDTHHEAWNVIEDNDYASYQAGLQFSYPIGNRKAQYTYKQSLKELEKADEQMQNLESVITVEVRDALRQIQTGVQRIAASRSAVESEQAKLDSQLKRYDVGMATSFEVLTFQQDLATARVLYLNALVTYNKALIEYDRVRSRIRDRLLAMGIPVELLSDAAADAGPETDSRQQEGMDREMQKGE